MITFLFKFYCRRYTHTHTNKQTNKQTQTHVPTYAILSLCPHVHTVSVGHHPITHVVLSVPTQTVDPEILSSVLKIISALRCGAYQRAESYYLEVSIGNAAWPMGVTMVGIHERAARERIQTNQIARMRDNFVCFVVLLFICFVWLLVLLFVCFVWLLVLLFC